MDDTTLTEVVQRGGQSAIQVAVTAVEQWSITNKLQLNPDKCKEMLIDFKRTQHQFDAITVDSKELERVNSVKVFGVTIASTLRWNCHISDVLKKANKRMFFPILLKRAKVPVRDIISLYLTCIRPVLEYCAPLYHHALPDYLSNDIERVQKRALSLISPGLSYLDSLSLFNLNSLKDRRIKQCNKFFEPIVFNTENKLHHFLPPKNHITHNLRDQRQFVNPIMHTKRFSLTYLPATCRQ